MKTIRFLLALGFVSTLAVAVRAADEKPKQPAGCDCAKDKDGKVCGVDKDCCCTGQKACKVEEKKADEKPAAKKEEKKEEKPKG